MQTKTIIKYLKHIQSNSGLPMNGCVIRGRVSDPVLNCPLSCSKNKSCDV